MPPIDVVLRITPPPASRMWGTARRLNRTGGKPINLNFFCHKPPVPNNAREHGWRERLKPYYAELGIDPKKRHLLVVKSTQHFHQCFAPIASKIIYVGAPGTLSTNYLQFPYKRMPRPMAVRWIMSWSTAIRITMMNSVPAMAAAAPPSLAGASS